MQPTKFFEKALVGRLVAMDADELEVTGRVALEKLPRAVAGAVVVDDGFRRAGGLRQQAVQLLRAGGPLPL
jgi:hypothetical protein